MGWWNRRGRLAPSIFPAKGDLATWLNASFMALFPRPYGAGSYSCAYGDIPRHKRKSHWAEFWIFAYMWHRLSPRKIAQSQVMRNSSESGDELFHRAQRNSFFSSSISRCMSLSFFARETWLFPRDWFLLVCVVYILPSWSPFCWGFTTELLCWESTDFA